MSVLSKTITELLTANGLAVAEAAACVALECPLPLYLTEGPVPIAFCNTATANMSELLRLKTMSIDSNQNEVLSKCMSKFTKLHINDTR